MVKENLKERLWLAEVLYPFDICIQYPWIVPMLVIHNSKESSNIVHEFINCNVIMTLMTKYKL